MTKIDTTVQNGQANVHKLARPVLKLDQPVHLGILGMVPKTRRWGGQKPNITRVLLKN